MSIVIGSKEQFAVEYELTPTSDGDQARWLFGRMCFWVRNHMIGNYAEGCALSVALASLPRLLRNRGNRVDESLLHEPATKAFQRIYSGLYVDSGQSNEQVQSDKMYFSRFVAVDTGFDVFDGWAAFLIEGSTGARFLWKDPAGTLYDVGLYVGVFDQVLDQFLGDLERRSGQQRKL
jgi:hypothetical protein